MIGTCIRKRDDKSLIYKLEFEKWELKIYIHDDHWKFIGDQENYERDYKFQDELSAGILIHCLYSDMFEFEEEYISQFVEMNNDKRNFTDQAITQKVCEVEKVINVICTKDVLGFHVYDNPKDKKKRFICRNVYMGLHFTDSHYILIGEKITWEETYDESVNGKIVATFLEKNDLFMNFNDHFFIMNPDETKAEAWKRYQVKIATDRFDL